MVVDVAALEAARRAGAHGRAGVAARQAELARVGAPVAVLAEDGPGDRLGAQLALAQLLHLHRERRVDRARSKIATWAPEGSVVVPSVGKPSRPRARASTT